MLILALETSTDAGSCALLHNASITYADCPRGIGASGQHSATLLPQIKQLLADAGVGFAQLDAIAFGAGPGAFTGLRMACALAQGLAVAHDTPLIPVGTLEAMAWQARQQGLKNTAVRISALLDARMNEVYSQSFDLEGENIRPAAQVVLCSPESLTFDDRDVQIICGNGLLAYPILTERAEQLGACLMPTILPHASTVAELAKFAYLRGDAVDAALAVPFYVRDKVAKTVVERLAEGGRA